MYNNPFFNGFNGYRDANQQQPIQNIINTQMPMQDMFMARFLNANENVQDIFVNHKTAFIDLNNKKLIVKDVNGDIQSFGLILPLDEKDKKINALEEEINKLKEMVNNEQSNNAIVPTIYEDTQQETNVKKPSRK